MTASEPAGSRRRDPHQPPRSRGATATRATYVAFIASGLAAASWASRIPQVKAHLNLDASTLGFVLLAIAAGSVISLPLAGMIVNRFGSARTVQTTAVLVGVGMVIISIGYEVGVPVVVAGLFLFGLAYGSWDVAMNVQGALVEREVGHPIMPRFHAGFSVGTVVGALIGVGMVALHVSVTAHLIGVGVFESLAVPFAVRGFLADDSLIDDQTGPRAAAEQPVRRFARWRETRTLLVGLFVLAFAFAEGTGNDWISLAIIQSHHAAAAVGTLGYALFLAAMTSGRWVGPHLLAQLGRVRTIRMLATIGVVGVVVFAFGPGLPVAFAGAVLWGIGASLGFPLGMSAGADEPAFAAARVSVIASIGYCAFLGGPPLIGFLADHLTIAHALALVAVLLVVAILIAGAVRPPPPHDSGPLPDHAEDRS
jgi:fucose permease